MKYNVIISNCYMDCTARVTVGHHSTVNGENFLFFIVYLIFNTAHGRSAASPRALPVAVAVALARVGSRIQRSLSQLPSPRPLAVGRSTATPVRIRPLRFLLPAWGSWKERAATLNRRAGAPRPAQHLLRRSTSHVEGSAAPGRATRPAPWLLPSSTR